MQTLYVMCGVPASGKTTFSKQLAETYGLTRFSYDEMRCFDLRDLMKPTIKALEEGQNVIVDNVNNRISGRKQILNYVLDISCKKILIFMDTSLEECIKRNSFRQYPLPDYFINGIHHALQPPTLDEGWDEIIVINNDEDIESYIKNLNLFGGDDKLCLKL